MIKRIQATQLYWWFWKNASKASQALTRFCITRMGYHNDAKQDHD